MGTSPEQIDRAEDREKFSTIIDNLGKLNIVVTPHIGGMTIQGQNRAFEWAASKFI